MDVDILLEKANTVAAARAEEFEAGWMLGFVPRVREHDVGLELFQIDPPVPFVEEHFSHLSPAAIPIYENVFSRTDEFMRADAFTKGAVCVTNLFQESTAYNAGNLISRQVEMMVERQEYPAVDEDFLTAYVDVMVAILCNEERSTWRDMLSYSAGVWWMMGLTGGCFKSVSRHGKSFYQAVFDIVIAQAKRGSMGLV